MNTRDKIKLANKLLALGTRRIEPERRGLGICFNTRQGAVIRRIAQDWSGYSGSFAYPVPHRIHGEKYGYCTTADLWADNEYGNARRELCCFIGERLIQELPL